MADSLSQVVNSETLKMCTVLLTVLALPSLLAAEKQCHPGITYLDPVTGNCDPCSDICHFTNEQGTLVRCETLCKGYCPKDEYYDKTVDRCEPCQSICLHPRAGNDCQTHCPDWSSRGVSTSTSRPDPHNFTVSGGGNVEGDGDGNKLSAWVYAALIGVGVMLVCMLGVLAVILREPCIKKIKNISMLKCRKLPHQEQEGSNPMLPPARPIVRPGRGPFASPTEDQHIV